jgi:hypothetical protein
MTRDDRAQAFVVGLAFFFVIAAAIAVAVWAQVIR